MKFDLLNSATDGNTYNVGNNAISIVNINKGNNYHNTSLATSNYLIGKLHNEGLDYFIQHCHNSYKSLSPAAINNILLEYVNSVGYINNPSATNDTLSMSDMYFLNTYLYKIQNISDDSSINSLALVGNLLNNLYNSVSEDQSLSSFGKLAIIFSLDVAYQSAYYWYVQTNLGSQSLWIIKGGNTHTNPPGWKKLFASDMMGAFWGFVGSGGNPLATLCAGLGASCATYFGF
jgi:hypothetical protein